MTTSGLGADARWPLPRGLIVVLSMTGLLVSVLALKQFAGIIAPVLLALILVISIVARFTTRGRFAGGNAG